MAMAPALTVPLMQILHWQNCSLRPVADLAQVEAPRLVLPELLPELAAASCHLSAVLVAGHESRWIAVAGQARVEVEAVEKRTR